MELSRACGILLHPISLPGPFGIGDIGPSAYQFVDFLVQARQTVWQVLPLTPVGVGDSPYAGRSAFAGNPVLVSLERLADDGLLQPDDLVAAAVDTPDRIDYARVGQAKARALGRAFSRLPLVSQALRTEFEAFKAEQAHWLDDFALFEALKTAHAGAWWIEWDPEFALRNPTALARARRVLANEIEQSRFEQFVFFRQWLALRQYANAAGIALMGDAPIFVAHDSADVWAHRELFRLDDQGRPTVVAGVPPDYFSKTGQLWGNPIYDWPRLAESGYDWWVDRLRACLGLYDYFRLDHFRGFQAYWEVPATETTAIRGRWKPGPGAALFEAAAARLGSLPIIAEDLGLITRAVKTLRQSLGYPGMKVMQFAFDSDARNDHLPHNLERECVVYTGTHDNDTTRGWFAAAGPGARQYLDRYVGQPVDSDSVVDSLLRLVYSSVAVWAIVPLQDALGLDTSGRMNQPGILGGNWSWRYRAGALTPELARKLADLATTYGRAPGAPPEEEVVEEDFDESPDAPSDTPAHSVLS